MWILIEKILSSVNPEPLSSTSIKCNQVLIQAKRANAGAVGIGDSNLTATLRLELTKPVADSQISVLTLGGTGQNCVNLDKLYLKGAIADGVNILYEIF